MFSTQRRTKRLAVVLGTTAALAGGITLVGEVRGGSASTPSAGDICVVVPSVTVHNQQIYPGGLVCVPVPFAQPTT